MIFCPHRLGVSKIAPTHLAHLVYGEQWSKKMDIYKTVVNLQGKRIEVVLKLGVMASVETGTHIKKVRKAKQKINVIAGLRDKKPAAWVQVIKFSPSGAEKIFYEGWVGPKDTALISKTSEKNISAFIERIPTPTKDILKCQSDATFGPLACCTAYGSGCYVTCCGGCCADPVGCPGAGCCP
jgi:hypothetical protein